MKKHSKKRDAILELIQSTSSHPSARWIYEQLKDRIPGLSLATVYRNISLFLKEGTIISVGVVNGEEHFDGFIDPRPHLICTHCGRVIDIPNPNMELLRVIAEQQQELRLIPHGFSIDYRRVIFYGICEDCSMKNAESTERAEQPKIKQENVG
ncbi:MAG: transcriptional repressor [Treponema sp.]|jgi:Fur family peroxide stress response transcriptional regulator|nr:transcriptional repressor [Treponema sp.]